MFYVDLNDLLVSDAKWTLLFVLLQIDLYVLILQETQQTWRPHRDTIRLFKLTFAKWKFQLH